MSSSREAVTGWQDTLGWAGSLLLCMSGFGVTAWLAAYSQPQPIVGYVVGFSCVVAASLGVSLFVPQGRGAGRAGAAVALGLMAYAVLSQAQPRPALPALCVLCGLLLLGTWLGALIGRRIQEPSHLLFVASVSAMADSLSVLSPGGVSHEISQEPAALAVLALPWPLLGTPEVAPFLGVSDVVFASLYIHATRCHGMPVARTLIALALGFVATAALVLVTERVIPVLPLLGASILVAQPRARAASPRDLRRGAWMLAALVSVIAGVFFLRAQ